MIKDILLKIMRSVLLEEDITYINGNEWINLCLLLREEKLSVAVGDAIYKNCPLEYQIYLDEIILQAKNNSFLYLNELKRIDSLFTKNSIPYILMKGMSLSQQIYEDCLVRVSSDIDLLVDVKFMRNAYSLLSKLGYKQHVYFDEHGSLVTVDKDCSIYGEADHEIKCIKKLKIKNFIGVEIQKATTAIPYKYINDFKRNVINININGLIVQTTNITYSFIHLLANAYENSESIMGTLRNCGIRDYFDIMVFLKKYQEEIEWDKIEALSEKYRIKHLLYAVLTNCQELFGSDLISYNLIKRFKVWQYSDSCTSKGYIIGWTSSFEKRVFNDELRIKESYWYLRNRIPKHINCAEYQSTDVLSISLVNTNLKIRFKWRYDNDERLVISMLNKEPNKTLFSDIYIYNRDTEVQAFFCPCSNIKGIPNHNTKIVLLNNEDTYVLNLNVSDLIIDGLLYFKILKQKKIINDYFIRIYLDKQFDFFSDYYKLEAIQENN